jgi:hypothetical protein
MCGLIIRRRIEMSKAKILKDDYIKIIDSLLALPQETTGMKQLKKITIERVLRKYSDELPPKYISKESYFQANQKNIKLDIEKHGSIHKIRKSSIDITLDHTTPINQLIDELLNGIDVNVVLDKNFTVAIMKTEDNKLNIKGYRRSRKPNWEHCYKTVSIELERNPIYEGSFSVNRD